MARYEAVAFALCGHIGQVRLDGTIDERNRRRDWLERLGMCGDCYRENKQYERECDLERQQAEVSKMTLPLISSGSDKQIAWATAIRVKALAYHDCLDHADVDKHTRTVCIDANRVFTRSSYAGQPVDAGRIDAIHTKIRTAIEAARRDLETKTDAKWWIDNRHALSRYMHKAGAKAVAVDLAQLKAECEALEAAAAAKHLAERQAQWAVEISERQTRQSMERSYTASLSDLKVASIDVDRGDFVIITSDGFRGYGFIREDEWVLCQVDGHHLDVDHTVAKRIAADARAMYKEKVG